MGNLLSGQHPAISHKTTERGLRQRGPGDRGQTGMQRRTRGQRRPFDRLPGIRERSPGHCPGGGGGAAAHGRGGHTVRSQKGAWVAWHIITRLRNGQAQTRDEDAGEDCARRAGPGHSAPQTRLGGAAHSLSGGWRGGPQRARARARAIRAHGKGHKLAAGDSDVGTEPQDGNTSGHTRGHTVAGCAFRGAPARFRPTGVEQYTTVTGSVQHTRSKGGVRHTLLTGGVQARGGL